ncbi:MAG: hypothetical protein ABI666_09735 [Ferruginibacter sp.]
MKNPEKITEMFLQTLFRTVIAATIISLILYSIHVIPFNGKSKLTEYAVIWAAFFSIFFVGHWIELLFINVIKFRLPRNIYVLYIVRVCYWFVSSILLFLIANTIRELLVSNSRQLGNWWSFGFLYIGVQLLMYAIMHIRLKKSFYNGIY